MFLFYESKIKPELGTVKKQTLIVLYVDGMCYLMFKGLYAKHKKHNMVFSNMLTDSVE